MSTGAQVAILDSRGLQRTRASAEAHPTERPRIRVAAFAALGLYGALRWGTMLTPAPVWRLLGLLALTVVVVWFGPLLLARNRVLGVLALVVAALAIFPLAGIPLSWVRHVRITVTANAIDEGLSGLPRAFLPYAGINQWMRMVIVLGAGALLMVSALTLAVGPRPLGELRRAAAALPLVVLAAVPSTLLRPSVAYVHGLLLFALLAAFVWGERIPRHDAPLALGITALAALAAMIAAPALDQHSPWVNYELLAGKLTPGNVEAFDWSQRYGPLNWPRTGREVLDVSAARPDYWKTEALELFSGSGWAAGSTNYGQVPPGPSAAALARWSQTIQVTLRGMRTQEVVAAGYASAPADASEPISQGVAAGTWTTAADMQPGDSYRIATYSPQPTPAELRAAPQHFPVGPLTPNLTMVLDQALGPAQEVVFPPFWMHAFPVDFATGEDARPALASSPYARVYALARRLGAGVHTPAGYVAAVMRFLAHGYTYNESPQPATFPLVSFLFDQKAGYCQQFAGAMALLLRMGGVPARVATGFTTGVYDRNRHQYVVSDLDAHAWVEAWFPTYGWVRFDPTPASAPARSGRAILPAIKAPKGSGPAVAPVRHNEPAPSTAAVKGTTGHRGGGGGVPTGLMVAGLGGVVVLVLGGLALTVRLREPSGEELLSELERAFGRCGRPVGGGLTLAALEHRYRTIPDAAGYVGALRRMRFAGGGPLPTRAQRRALRGQLRSGLGVLGRARALWALPPRWVVGGRRRSSGGPPPRRSH